MNSLPLHIARKYIFSGKNAIEVNVISWIALISLGFVTACLVIILSVFSGLENFNLKYYSDINPDLQISPSKGKIIPHPEKAEEILNSDANVKAFSRVIQEKSFITSGEKNHIITLKGVDQNINQIFPLDSMIMIGTPLSTQNNDNVLLGPGVATSLAVYVDDTTPMELYVPKPGKGLITNEKEAFSKTQAFNSGIFRINETYHNYVFSTLQKAQELLNLKPNNYYYLEIKTTPNSDLNKTKTELQNSLGDEYQVKTRQELDAAFLKMMNTENLMIYLILILVLIIASFNLAGSVAILIIYKKPESSTLWSMGMDNKNIKKIFFYTGFSISFYALIIGLFLGTLIAWLQQQYGFYKINFYIPYPVKFTWSNYLITIVSVLIIGFLVSWLVSRQAKVTKVISPE